MLFRSRVKSLTNGISGQLFEDEMGIQDSVLFDEKTIYINADGNVRDNIESALKIIFEEV